MSAAAAAADAAPKNGGKKKLLIILAAVGVLVAGGGGAAVYLMKKKAAEAAAAEEGEDADAASHATSKHAGGSHDKKTPPVFVPLDPFVVNLADREADRYAQIGITLQVVDAHAGDEIGNYKPSIRNNILMLLAHKTSEDLAGREGKEQLAAEVRREALRAMGYEVEDEEPAAADGEGKAKKKKKKKAAEDLPIVAVQFSSFIIQ